MTEDQGCYHAVYTDPLIRLTVHGPDWAMQFIYVPGDDGSEQRFQEEATHVNNHFQRFLHLMESGEMKIVGLDTPAPEPTVTNLGEEAAIRRARDVLRD